MELTELFDLEESFDAARDGEGARTLAQAFRDRAVDDDDSIEARLAAVDGLVDRSAAWTAFSLGGDVEAKGSEAVHRVATFALALGRHRDALVDPSASASNAMHDDLQALVNVATGEPVALVGPFSRYVAGILEELSSAPGFPRGRDPFRALFAALLEGLVQEYRLHAIAKDDEVLTLLSPSERGGWVDLVIEAACIVRDDTCRATREQQADTVARIAAGAIAVARELGQLLRGADSEPIKKLLCSRFAVVPHVIQLDDEGLRRALSATLELEVRDLIDAVSYLPPRQPRAGIVRRAVAGIIELDGSAHVVVSALTGDRPVAAEVMKEMSAVARADGQITSDERAMLRGMDTQLLEFQRLMERVEEDRRVDEEEFEQLRNTRQGVLDQMFRIALADYQIIPDERDLLLRAMELVPSLR